MDRDIPSTIDYKEQGRDLSEIRRRHQQANALADDLPSDIDNKDQGRNPSEILRRRQDNSVDDLPSSIDYKDQGRDLRDVLARARAGRTNPPTHDTNPNHKAGIVHGCHPTGDNHAIMVHAVPVRTNSVLRTEESGTGTSTPSSDNNADEFCAFQFRKTTLYLVFGMILGMMVLGVVAVVVWNRRGDGSSDDDGAVRATANQGPVATMPTLMPTELPTLEPTTSRPTQVPTDSPTSSPTRAPTNSPTSLPTEPLCSYCPIRPFSPLPDCSVKPARATCTDIFTSEAKFGLRVQGVDLRCYTGGVLEWIGCRGADSYNCSPDTFSCADSEDRLEFGTSSGRYLAALFDPQNCCPVDGDPGRLINFCATTSTPNGIMNTPTTQASATALCQALGYNFGRIETGSSIGCPVVQHGGGGPSDWIFTRGSFPRARVYICTTYPPTENPTTAPTFLNFTSSFSLSPTTVSFQNTTNE